VVLLKLSDRQFIRSFSSLYEGVSRSFRTGRLERELQMIQLSATRYSCIAALWVNLVSFAAITLCVASQRVFVVVYFVIDSVRKLLDTPSYTIAAIPPPPNLFTPHTNSPGTWYRPVNQAIILFFLSLYGWGFKPVRTLYNLLNGLLLSLYPWFVTTRKIWICVFVRYVSNELNIFLCNRVFFYLNNKYSFRIPSFRINF
jgi:hypothetical protein